MTAPGLLGIALGTPGSGRQRYAKAMSMYQSGHLSTEQLEAYRVAAASDALSPSGVFAERNLPLPGNQTSPVSAIQSLLDAADHYLAGLVGPGIDEVRRALARYRGGPVTVATPAANPALTAHLPAALAALRQTHPGLADAIDAAHPHLRWITYDAYDPAQIGAEFARGHAFASILGDAAAIPATDFDFGLFLIAPNILYRDHNHAAPELYAPLTGPHGWRFGADLPLQIKPAHDPVWNPPFTPHLTKVGPVPFLCLYAWTRDVEHSATVIAANDWPELEALRLDP
jgi:hypothetical protein